jgi:hypothetical protein
LKSFSQVISEEHDNACNATNTSLDVVDMGGHILPDLMVANQDVTIWIDPLDATKEYTGIIYRDSIKKL